MINLDCDNNMVHRVGWILFCFIGIPVITFGIPTLMWMAVNGY